MVLTATDISLIFLGILLVFVLLEVRKLSRRPEPGTRLEAQFEALTEQMARMGVAPPDMELPGGAQIVDASRSFETISEQLERLGVSAADLDAEMLGDDEIRRLVAGLARLRTELRAARQMFDSATTDAADAVEAMRAVGVALQAVERGLDQALTPSRRHDDRA
jgi:hypothetical protein